MEQLPGPQGRRRRGSLQAEAATGRGHPALREQPAVQHLLDHRLIDDFRLWVFPLVLGNGKHLFRDREQPTKLQLADTTTFRTGVVVLCYGRA